MELKQISNITDYYEIGKIIGQGLLFYFSLLFNVKIYRNLWISAYCSIKSDVKCTSLKDFIKKWGLRKIC